MGASRMVLSGLCFLNADTSITKAGGRKVRTLDGALMLGDQHQLDLTDLRGTRGSMGGEHRGRRGQAPSFHPNLRTMQYAGPWAWGPGVPQSSEVTSYSPARSPQPWRERVPIHDK